MEKGKSIVKKNEPADDEERDHQKRKRHEDETSSNDGASDSENETSSSDGDSDSDTSETADIRVIEIVQQRSAVSLDESMKREKLRKLEPNEEEEAMKQADKWNFVFKEVGLNKRVVATAVREKDNEVMFLVETYRTTWIVFDE